MRKKIVAGNWKLNKTPQEAVELINSLKDKIDTDKVDVLVCPTFVCLQPVLDAVKGTNIAVGAQNMHFAENGAYTGEISAEMLTSIGVKYVVLGHSERRQYFNETDETVNKKVLTAIKHNLVPIICVGESLEEREQGITIDLVRLQTKVALKDVSADDAKDVVIAYEPVWAIGTGKTATSAQAEEVCKAIREVVAEIYTQEVADAVRIQYGGSVNGANANELFNMGNIDGGLVGGASLKPEFAEIVNY
ncbi:MAG: triose-phosphate isomerase [Epulopiscium sp. Nele67-Bin004]|nr:MAG: triose-phosphate isomerase [Epulopiscium sp. Nele67-Bin004]